MGELYGEVNKLTMEWQDGLMAVSVRQSVQVIYHKDRKIWTFPYFEVRSLQTSQNFLRSAGQSFSISSRQIYRFVFSLA